MWLESLGFVQCGRAWGCTAAVEQSWLASAAGHELLFDARLVRGEHITDGSTIMAASSPNANNYTVLTPEKAAEMEAASPASLLAKSVNPFSHFSPHHFPQFPTFFLSFSPPFPKAPQ